ncbi:MFS transporter [Sphaerisporangium rubeum]|uniref:Putative MFS family arabinose efflux permease n=1 Tax=Sphaerisporangium rubeum TaxID=321317 RepID=A0A7X0IER8_9ACTN|nr:MFS transporter [Sphaerisporangium rubeum]MBB6473880.1 putative MFS family arabinose efflux permease [Sphaerisporangium rubeum]
MPERFGSRPAIVALIALALAAFLYVTTESLPIGLLPLMARDLGTSASAVGLLVTGYGLVVVVVTLPLTRMTRRIPRRRLLCVLLGVFALATCLSAVAGDYWLLMGARMVTALSQAVFWAVVTPAAAGLFRPEVRGKAMAVLYAGASSAAVAGVPAGTWLGQQAGWRTVFLVLGGLGLVVLAVVAAVLPGTPAGRGAADRGSAPDRGRYLVIVAGTATAVTGAFAAFTYIGPFLTEVSGFAESSIGPLLLARGVAGVAGVVVAGYLADRHAWHTMAGLTGLQALALAAQYLLGGSPVATVAAVALSGFTMSGLTAVLGSRVLTHAPGTSDMASAGMSTAFNVGITAGAFLGGVLLPLAGPGGTVLAGALLSLVAFAVMLAEPAFSSRAATVASPRLGHAGTR